LNNPNIELEIMMQSLLEGYPVVVEFPVAWGDMDALQHVNNVAYLRYFEHARVAYSKKVGLHDYRDQTGIGPILGSVHCKYKLPLTYPDVISVGAKITKIEEDRVTMKHVVISQRHRKIAAEGEGVIVMYNYREGKKTAIPDALRLRLVAFEGK
jgi:acyl-CoA thioester hydrolase